MIIVKRFGSLNYKVYLDKKHVGNILCDVEQQGWYYKPKNSDQRGEIFKTWQECKESLY